MKREIKIGILLFIFVAFCLVFATWIKGNPFGIYKIKVFFSNVHGLHKGSVVEYEGLNCGEVNSFDILKHGFVINIIIKNPKLKIYKTDKFIVVPNSTIASEYEIIIKRGKRPAEEINPAKDILTGTDSAGVEDFTAGLENTLEQVSISLVKIHEILDKTNKSLDYLEPLMTEAITLAKNTNETSKLLNSTISENRENIKQTVNNLNNSLVKVQAKLDALPEQDMRQSVTLTRENLEKIKSLLSGVSQKDIQAFSDLAQEARNIAQKAQSNNPNEDIISLTKNTLKRINRISDGLEKSLKNKSLLKVLFSEIRMKPEVKEIKETEKNAEQDKQI